MSNDKAVSPVIGVILMIAITVIFAAIIAELNIQQNQPTPPGPVKVNVTIADKRDQPANFLNPEVLSILSSSNGETYYFDDYFTWDALKIGSIYTCQIPDMFFADHHLTNCVQV